MKRHIASAFFVIGIGLAVACSVEVDITNKACPCGPGYICETVSQKCLVTLPTVVPPVERKVCDPCKCKTTADCTEPTRPFCDPGLKECVECDPTPTADKCPGLSFCNEKFQCTPGCKTNDDCMKFAPGSPTCAVDRHQCVICVLDTDCPSGQKCGESGTCAKTCTNGQSDCAGGSTCCGQLCIDPATDRFNCGGCNTRCTVTNGTPTCAGSTCGANCSTGFKHCGSGPAACETNIRMDPKNCGDCGTVCAIPNVTKQLCVVGKCNFEACAPRRMDLDGDPANGCEEECGTKQNQRCCPGNDPCYDDKKCRPLTTGKHEERGTCE